MVSESVQPVRIGSGDQRFPKPGRYFFRAAVQVEEALMKMAELYRVKAIHFCKQARSY